MKKLLALLLSTSVFAGPSVYRKERVDFLRAQQNSTNYILNGDAEDNLVGWTGFKDAAATTPGDCSGGTMDSAVTFTRSASSPIQGDASFLLSRTASSSYQGNGVAYTITPARRQAGTTMAIRFDYETAGTFVGGSSSTSSDVSVWVYDVANSAVITPANQNIRSASLAGRYLATFAVPTNGTTFRVCLYLGTSATAAWTVKVDNFEVFENSFYPVEAYYTRGSTQSIPDNTATAIVYSTEIYDSAFSYNSSSGVYTVPSPGSYLICASANLTSGGGWNIGEEAYLSILKNGATSITLQDQFMQAAHAQFVYNQGCKVLQLIKNDTIAIRLLQNSGGAINITADANTNRLDITKLP